MQIGVPYRLVSVSVMYNIAIFTTDIRLGFSKRELVVGFFLRISSEYEYIVL